MFYIDVLYRCFVYMVYTNALYNCFVYSRTKFIVCGVKNVFKIKNG